MECSKEDIMTYFSRNKGEKKVLITGGSKGIGKDIAIAFAELGADVVITGRNEADLVTATEELKQIHSGCSYIAADMQNVQQVYHMVDEAIARMNGIDILINNAGVNIPKPALEVTEEEWDQVLDTNLKGVFFCTQRAGKYMTEQNKGKSNTYCFANGVCRVCKTCRLLRKQGRRRPIDKKLWRLNGHLTTSRSMLLPLHLSRRIFTRKKCLRIKSFITMYCSVYRSES
ncbi:hypothetical protein GCM10020331_026100 [Ectobacillus funiculus]